MVTILEILVTALLESMDIVHTLSICGSGQLLVIFCSSQTHVTQTKSDLNDLNSQDDPTQ